jgi:predicted AlkP superfamily phosphohydrolase/phosphomutase
MSPIYAYIGPGAGFAFLGSFLSLIASFFLTAAALLLWPFRAARAAIRRKRNQRKSKIKKLIFLGLDGLDPRLTERYMAAGKLPNFARLKNQGSFHRLRTTFPALSPVAWSTFATGVSPAKHNIFDFLNRSLKTYAPELAPSKVKRAQRILRLGRLRLPLSAPIIEMRRKSESFWKILGDHSIPSTILRVPITFPPEDFNGRLLSAMCTPDLRGTQGSYTQFTAPANTLLEARLEGPTNELLEGAGATAIPFRLTAQPNNTATLEIANQTHHLKRGEYTPWLRLSFNAVPGINIHGIARFLLTETEPELKLYVTPIQIDPESPALPISHPAYYATYLAKLQGGFATVGMAEDTWALNDSAIDETDFLTQAYSIMDEREAMFANALAHTKQGVVACVFDTSDRVQHMFFRHLDGHGDPRYAHVIENLYERMDSLLGKALEHLDDDTILFALSDHGFCAFRRAVNLNSWLHQNGYLALTEESTIDWPNTRAYCLGLSGLYLNLKGREAQGTVTDAEALKTELIAKLTGLRDDEKNETAITHVYATNRLYKGPYLTAAPDLIIGYNEGYRTSWDAAVGKVTTQIIEDNPKAWSGDHCVDPLLVPGVLFSSRKIDAEDPGIEDMAPTALNLFGLPTPLWMDGKSVFTT